MHTIYNLQRQQAIQFHDVKIVISLYTVETNQATIFSTGKKNVLT